MGDHHGVFPFDRDDDDDQRQDDNPACLYEWPKETYVDGNYIYPQTKKSRCLTVLSLKTIQKLVGPCLDWMDPDLGNIAPLIAENLSKEYAERERAVLPQLDYVHAVYDVDVKCQVMLRSMIPWVQREHAHNLAAEGMEDLRITHLHPKLEQNDGSDWAEKRMIYFTEEEFKTYKQAEACVHKNYDDGRRMAHDPKGVQLGGFYACVPHELYEALLKLAEAHHGRFQIKKMIEPKLINAEEEKELQAYYASRYEKLTAIPKDKKLDDDIPICTRELYEQRARDAAKKEYQERREKVTLTGARKRDLENMHRFNLGLGRH